MTPYLWLKLAHLASVIVAVGANVTYFVWFARLRKHPDGLIPILEGLDALDSRVANRAYGLILVTGLGLAWLGNWWTHRWLHIALALFVAVLVVALTRYTPGMRRLIAAAKDQGPASDTYETARQSVMRAGGILMVLVIGIVAMMVLKPMLP